MSKPVFNPIAKALRIGACQPKVVKARKGKGSYSRKGRLTSSEKHGSI